MSFKKRQMKRLNKVTTLMNFLFLQSEAKEVILTFKPMNPSPFQSQQGE